MDAEEKELVFAEDEFVLVEFVAKNTYPPAAAAITIITTTTITVAILLMARFFLA